MVTTQFLSGSAFLSGAGAQSGNRSLSGKGSLSGNGLSRRFGRFLATGFLGFACQIAALWLLHAICGLHYVAATIIAVEIAIIVNYVLHEKWTWRDRTDAAGAIGRLLRFNALTAVTSIAGGSW